MIKVDLRKKQVQKLSIKGFKRIEGHTHKSDLCEIP